MKDFLTGVNDKVISTEVKQVMIKENQFNRVLVQAFESVGTDKTTVNMFDSEMSTITPQQAVQIMDASGFSLIVDKGKIRFTHVNEKVAGTTQKEVALDFFDALDEFKK